MEILLPQMDMDLVLLHLTMTFPRLLNLPLTMLTETAAAAVLVVSSVVTAYLIGRSQAVVIAEAPEVVESGPSEVLLASFEGLGVDNYLATRAELMAALEARSQELSPETMDVVMENLLLIDQAMNRIAEALGEDPENEFLMKQLAGAYRRQIDLLQRAVRLPAEV